MHQAQQHRIGKSSDQSGPRLHHHVQYHESSLLLPHEHRHAHRPAGFVDGKQGLHILHDPDPDPEAPLELVDLWSPIGADALFDTRPYPMLVGVEKNQLLQRLALGRGKSGGDPDRGAQSFPRLKSPPLRARPERRVTKPLYRNAAIAISALEPLIV